MTTDHSENIKKIAREIGELTAEKNAAYGNSVATSTEVLRLLYPDGVKPKQYRDMLLVARVLDKLSRIANRKDAFGESPWRDIAGYGVIGAVNDSPETGEAKLSLNWKHIGTQVYLAEYGGYSFLVAKEDTGDWSYQILKDWVAVFTMTPPMATRIAAKKKCEVWAREKGVLA
jgi:hypothetical protein